MKEFVISEVKAETAVLVGLITKTQDEAKTKEYLDELEFLADICGGCHRKAIHGQGGLDLTRPPMWVRVNSKKSKNISKTKKRKIET